VDVTPKLIGLAVAIAPDGGHGLLRQLEKTLRELFPFHVGEIAVHAAGGPERRGLGGLDGALVGADLERHVETLSAPWRADDLDMLTGFSETAERLSRLGQRSLLVAPLRERDRQVGLLALARRDAFGFVTVPLRVFSPVAQMAGVCLSRALTLSKHGGAGLVDATAERSQRKRGRRRRKVDAEIPDLSA
jgi:hypothetical protein